MAEDQDLWRLTSEELVALGAMDPDRGDGSTIDGDAGLRSLIARGLLAVSGAVDDDGEPMTVVDAELARVVGALSAPSWVAVLSGPDPHHGLAIGRLFGRDDVVVLQQEALAVGVHDLKVAVKSPLSVIVGALLSECGDGDEEREPVAISTLADDVPSFAVQVAWDTDSDPELRSVAWVELDGGPYVIEVGEDADDAMAYPTSAQEIETSIAAFLDEVGS